jgi:exodeoxyribonuclease VII large subunit
MPGAPRLRISEADDPFAPIFLTVAALTERIKRSLENDFSEVALHGEVSNVTRPRSGHLYFTLKDDSASIRAVIWRNDAQRITFDLSDGLSVRALGRVTVYAPRGEYQIVVRHLEPEGIGALELAFRQRYARLLQEGLFDPARKRPLPRYPRGIVIVSSPTGAAVRDVLQVVGRRWRCVRILIAPTRVQGTGADLEVAAALELANRVNGVDLIVVARGGGSMEDLWTFNEEIVVRAIAQSRLPVVSAVGHEIDVTLADLAADRRALTPSEAGEVSVPDAREVLEHLDRLAERLRSAGTTQLKDAQLRLQELAQRARLAIGQAIQNRRHAVARLAASLEALSPLGVLGRGYSLTFQADGRTVIRDSREVKNGDLIRTRLSAGSIASQVVSTESHQHADGRSSMGKS